MPLRRRRYRRRLRERSSALAMVPPMPSPATTFRRETRLDSDGVCEPWLHSHDMHGVTSGGARTLSRTLSAWVAMTANHTAHCKESNIGSVTRAWPAISH